MVRRLALALVALIAMSTAGCGDQPAAPSIAVGATTDAESTLVAHLYAAALRSYGSPAHVQIEDDPLTELDSAEVMIVPGFTGRLLARFDPDATARSAAQVYRTMVSALPEGVAAGDYTTSAEDKPALAVTEATADAWDARDATAVVRHCDTVKIGQVDGVPRPQSIGTCKAQTRGYPDSATLFAALQAGEINAAWTSTAAPNIPTEVLMLSDRTSLIRAENVVPLYRRNELSESQVLAINEVAGVLDTAALAQMRAEVDDGTEPGLVANGFLAEHPLGD